MPIVMLILSLLFAAEAVALEPQAAPLVWHEPLQPKPEQSVVITAKLPAGVTTATLKVQVVAPGKYLRKSDPAYEAEWTDLPMRKMDGVFSVRVPGKYQQHRHLIRYRIVTLDHDGKTIRLPVGDTCPELRVLV